MMIATADTMTATGTMMIETAIVIGQSICVLAVEAFV